MNIQRSKLLIAMGLALFLATAWGCSGSPPPADNTNTVSRNDVAPPSEKTTTSAPTPTPDKASAGDEEEDKEWAYDPSYKWDPFVMPQVQDADTGPAKFDLDQMQLYGIIRGSNMDRAFILLPDGTDLIVKIGDNLGKRGGEVTEIGLENITVEEKYIDPTQPDNIIIVQKKLPLVKLVTK